MGSVYLCKIRNGEIMKLIIYLLGAICKCHLMMLRIVLVKFTIMDIPSQIFYVTRTDLTTSFAHLGRPNFLILELQA